MALDGRINVDVLFHDTDGTTSLKVVSLEDSTSYTTGKVAVVSGTLGTAVVQIDLAPTTYRNSSGNLVSFSTVTAMAGKTSRRCSIRDNADFLFAVDGDRAFVHPLPITPPYVEVAPTYTSGTATYTLVLYGT